VLLISARHVASMMPAQSVDVDVVDELDEVDVDEVEDDDDESDVVDVELLALDVEVDELDLLADPPRLSFL